MNNNKIKKIKALNAQALMKKKLDEEEQLSNDDYLIHHIEVDKDGNEIIHHCYLYDHMANLYEQGHLDVRKGVAYLDGKKIKEGHFHIIKGLEPTQEVVRGDDEAEKVGIKPKGMKAGMTLKEKAKVW